MIALPSQLPLLRIGRFETTVLEPDWIETSIREAAAAAGNDEWWFASDIVRSLMIYLRDRFDGTAITLEELAAKVRLTLEKIGFSEIGNKMRLNPPRLTLSLHDLAREAGDGFELRFFRLLESRLAEMALLGVKSVALTDSRDGVKCLCAAKNWSRACQDLEAEILAFLRGRPEAERSCKVELQAA